MKSETGPNQNFTENSETKEVVTPFAFSVAEELLGKPLASPLRRLAAITIDLLMIALLTLLSSFVLALVVLLVAAKARYAMRAEEGNRAVKASLLIAMVVCVLILATQLLIPRGEAPAETEVALSIAAVEPEVSSDSSFIEWLKEYLDDFGLSFGWAALYFTVLTAWWGGQTIGKKVMGILVVRIDGKKIDLWESFGRYGGYSAGVATGLIGFVQIYWDANRQAIHDKISETFVIRA